MPTGAVKREATSGRDKQAQESQSWGGVRVSPFRHKKMNKINELN